MTKQGPLAKNWCFTINNYTEPDIACLDEIDANYIIYGKETGEAEETPHLQGYVQLKKKMRLTGLKKLIPRAHWEKAKGDATSNVKYCSKEGDVTTKGEIVIKGKKKCDMVDCVKLTLDKTPTADILDKHGSGYIMNKMKIDNMAHTIEKEQTMAALRENAELVTLKEWQKKAIEILLSQNDREIMFIVDMEGGQGKSFLTDYLIAKENAIAFDNGKSTDIKYGYKGQRLVIFDLCRCEADFINYGVIENIKNGRFFNTKYESEQKIFLTKPKVVVMMNQLPDQQKLSADRYQVFLLINNEINAYL
jgi:hypothetical protein